MEQTVVAQEKKSKKSFHIRPWKIVVFAILVLYAVFLFLPLYIAFATSITSTDELTSTTSFIWFPEKPTFLPYLMVFTEDVNMINTGIPSLLLGVFNTLWMTLLPLVIGLFVSGLSAYAYSKLDFPGKEKLFNFAFILSMIPLGAFSIISYTFYSVIGWVGTPLPLIIPGMFGGMGTVFFLKMYYEGVPNSYLEAANIDGLGMFGGFFRIVFPLALPAFIAQFIFGFVGGYNNYLGPLLYLQGNPMSITLQLVLSDVTNIFPGIGRENIHCAAAVLGMLPLIILYCFLQKFFIEGISVGGNKD